MVTPQVPKGFRDFLPRKMIQRQRIISLMTSVFERFGFEPLGTPCLEYAETLEGKYGEEGEKLIYKFEDRGGRSVALRYDLTIPLCRVMAAYPELPKPFKRYQIAPVWRADKPQKGRFREFYQCDIDIIGSDSAYADAELLIITHTVLKQLGFKNFVMRVNNRKVLNALALKAGMNDSEVPSFLRVLDKIDKVGREGVVAELEQKGLLRTGSQSILKRFVFAEGDAQGRLEAILHELDGVPEGRQGVHELQTIANALQASGIPETFYEFDITLARGLDYYTGSIFETIVQEPKIGSITGGGRYDHLIGLFSKHAIPATGTSFGLERLLTVLEEKESQVAPLTTVQVMVSMFDEALMKKNLTVAEMLRHEGFNTEVYFSPHKLKKQLSYAANRGIPAVVIIGPDEAEQGRVTLRDMQRGTQQTVQQADMIATLRTVLDGD